MAFMLPSEFPTLAVKRIGEILLQSQGESRRPELFKAIAEVACFVVYLKFGDPDMPRVFGMAEPHAEQLKAVKAQITELLDSKEVKEGRLRDLSQILEAILPLLQFLLTVI